MLTFAKIASALSFSQIVRIFFLKKGCFSWWYIHSLKRNNLVAGICRYRRVCGIEEFCIPPVILIIGVTWFVKNKQYGWMRFRSVCWLTLSKNSGRALTCLVQSFNSKQEIKINFQLFFQKTNKYISRVCCWYVEIALYKCSRFIFLNLFYWNYITVTTTCSI